MLKNKSMACKPILKLIKLGFLITANTPIINERTNKKKKMPVKT